MFRGVRRDVDNDRCVEWCVCIGEERGEESSCEG